MGWSTQQTHRIVEQFWQNGEVRCPDDNGPLKLKLHKLHGGDYELHAECPLCGKSMRQHKSAKGEFWGCAEFPNCKGTRPT